MWFLYVLAAVLLILVALVWFLHSYVNDAGIPNGAHEGLFSKKHWVMLVVAHPDDEVMVAGTLARLHEAGSEVFLLYLTHGEDGPTGGLVEQSGLGAFRLNELQNVKAILGANHMEVLDFPDRYLNTVDNKLIKASITERIARFQPDIVITFDSSIGLYGHTDHLTAGRCTRELLKENHMGVNRLYLMTLPGKMIQLALKVSKTFRNNYVGSAGLPKPDFYVGISAYGNRKKAVCNAHKSQWQVITDVQPYYNKIPAMLYYRIFSREYFAIEELE